MPPSENIVAACRSGAADYPEVPPFHPDKNYPECLFIGASSAPNAVYDTVRNCFRALNLDAENFGTARWNPLSELIRPGETVLLKPNLVKESHPRDPEGWKYVLTHGSVIRAVADYVWKALEGRGKVVVADAPQTDSSFEQIARILGLNEIRDFYRAQGLDFELIDLRKEEWGNRDGVIVERRTLAGDPNDYLAFNLADRSEFAGHRGELRYYGADYDSDTLNSHHSAGRHEYLIAGSAITCDVIFSLPKLKTHKKAGITVSLKNLIGINGDKNWLPHHTEGDPSNGGDEHPAPDNKHKAERALVPYFRKLSTSVPVIGPWLHARARSVGSRVFGDTEEVIRSGNWWGNDTIWRTCLDLNKIVLYGNADGTLREDTPENRKRHFSLVDGFIAGEGRGPMNPDPVRAGLIVFGLNPASVDATCAYLMGFNPELIPIVRQAFRCRHYPLIACDWRDVRLVSDRPEWNGLLPEIAEAATFHFRPHFGWRGHIEREAGTEHNNAESGKPLSQAAGHAAKSRL
ncbi:MAG TPA: DUF362 domain-containing protein [Blastocatellia bacterium]|nr:DUF362 domain-containing protein [Blastocatellia bacterium]